LLVLQHIACKPPGAYEEELLARSGESHEREMTELARTLFSQWLEHVVGPVNPRTSA
jgi:hypothetical protein